MGLKNYDVTINGLQTTLRLSDEDARAQGLTPRDESAPKGEPSQPAKKTAAKKAAAKKAAPKPANKARTAEDK